MQNIELIDFRKIKTFLFDLDATLGPYVQNELSAEYFSRLKAFAGSSCVDADKFERAAGIAFKAMKNNSGSVLNGELFRKAFYEQYPDFPFDIDEFYDDYYNSEDFCSIGKQITHYRGTEKKMLAGLRKKGYKLVCATNPVFPDSANRERMSWAGIDPSDFDYITLHSNSHFCKPSAGYFTGTAEKAGSKPEQCLMVGNDTLDDLEADRTGMPVLMITDYLKDRGNRDLSGVCCCTYDEFLRLAENMGEAEV